MSFLKAVLALSFIFNLSPLLAKSIYLYEAPQRDYLFVKKMGFSIKNAEKGYARAYVTIGESHSHYDSDQSEHNVTHSFVIRPNYRGQTGRLFFRQNKGEKYENGSIIYSEDGQEVECERWTASYMEWADDLFGIPLFKTTSHDLTGKCTFEAVSAQKQITNEDGDLENIPVLRFFLHIDGI